MDVGQPAFGSRCWRWLVRIAGQAKDQGPAAKSAQHFGLANLLPDHEAFFLGLMLFSWQELPADPVLLVHLTLVASLMIVFPVSKLLHAPGILFSPTLNQADNPREQRHVAGWSAQIDNTKTNPTVNPSASAP